MSVFRSLAPKKFVLACATALGLTCAASGASAAFSSITVFGDSLSDGGNVYLMTGNAFPPSPYYNGRASNGLTAVEVLAASLGLPLTPSLAGGSNFAYIGAETGTNNYLAVRPDVPPIINLIFSGPGTGVLSQVQSFVPPAGFGGPQSLVVLWGGPNDLFTALQTGVDPATILLPAMNNIALSVGTLYAKGATSILMPNMPDIGTTPFGLNSGASSDLTLFSQAFDFLLGQTIAGLELAYPGLDIIPFDTFGAFAAIAANPLAYGLANVIEPCLDAVTMTVCANPDQYLFWDSVHPTARGHQLLGAAFLGALGEPNGAPEPGTIALLFVSVAGFAFTRRRGR